MKLRLSEEHLKYLRLLGGQVCILISNNGNSMEVWYMFTKQAWLHAHLRFYDWQS